jgi:acetyl esterase
MGHFMPHLDAERNHILIQKNVPYRDSQDPGHCLDAYIPTHMTRRAPVVMYVHGGGFAFCSKETHRVMAIALARRGYLVFNINYRLGPKNLYPAPLEDAVDALLWVVDNCERFGGDSTRIAVAGESAGGNLVTALAILHSYPRPEPFAKRLYEREVKLKAAIASYGFLDLTDADRFLGDPHLPRWAKTMLVDSAACYVGDDVKQAAPLYPLSSPLVLLEEGRAPARSVPPFFVTCGTKDPLLPHSRRLKDALDRLGVTCELLVHPGELHGYDAFLWRPAAQDKWRRAHHFLAAAMAD